ncbi:MAG: M42 family peptidase [Clostridia bacterium]|nr:M42 family peptidase [Clostridia bacterium]
MDYRVLQKLCNAPGVSGYEAPVAGIIADLISDYCDGLEYDRAGNLIAFKRGSHGSCGKRILCSCHMDEVGFVINHIDECGRLLFEEIGMMTRAYVGKRVLVGEKRIPGIIAVKPVHLLGSDERGKDPDEEKLFIDIGAKSRNEAEKLGVFANYAVFDSEYENFGDKKIKAKALDDRVGCAMLISLLKRGVKYDSYFSFCVGEELGLRGSTPVCERIKPDICINLECTTASDIYGVKGAKKVCTLGDGVAVPFMDNSAVYAPSLYRYVRGLADELSIPCQTKTAVAGGTDAGAYTKIAGGRATIGLAVPTRYIHSAYCVAQKSDIDACEELLFELSDRMDVLCSINERRYTHDR